MPQKTRDSDKIQQLIPEAWLPGLVKLCGVAPHTHGVKRPDGSWGQEPCPTPGKRPIEVGFNTAASKRYAGGKSWASWARLDGLVEHVQGGGNLGLVPPPGVAILDCDTEATVEWLGAALPKECPLMYRDAGSAHYYVRYDPRELALTARSIKWEENGVQYALDIRLPGKSQAVCPPSRHKTGKDYQWSEPLPEEILDVPFLPDGLAEFLRAWTRKEIEPRTSVEDMPGHDRIRDYTNRWARYLTREEDLIEKAREYAKEVYADRPERAESALVEGGEVDRLATSAWKMYGGLNPLEEHNTDAALVALYVAGGPIKFKRSAAEKVWYKWDGERWAVCAPEYVMQALVEFSDVLFDDAARELVNSDRRQRLALLSMGLRRTSKVVAVMKMLAAHESVLLDPEQLDANPWLMTFGSAPGYPAYTVNLKEWTCYRPKPEDLITHRTNAPYVPGLEWDSSPVVVGFLGHTFPDEELLRYVCMCLGISLVGLPLEHIGPFLFGRAGAGKSTFLNIINWIFGDYGSACPFEVLTARMDPQSASPYLATWRGKRLIVASEIPEGVKLGATYKNLTGGDTLTVRGLYQTPFKLSPSYTIWTGGNDAPKASHLDTGVARRMKVIPADQVLEHAQMDGHLPEKLHDPLAAACLMAWALEGLSAYLEDEKAFVPPAQVAGATASYLRAQNPLHDWVEENTRPGPGAVMVKVIRARYDAWLDEHFSPSERKGMKMSSMKIRGALEALGMKTSERKDRIQWVEGLVLVDADENSHNIGGPKLPE